MGGATLYRLSWGGRGYISPGVGGATLYRLSWGGRGYIIQAVLGWEGLQGGTHTGNTLGSPCTNNSSL